MTSGQTPHVPDAYSTLAGTGHSDLKIQRSRFISLAAPAADEPAARDVIADMAKQYHDSRHVCFGWRLGCGPIYTENRNDAGEPSGTAGEPILAAIRRADLSDCVVIVVRYFGGVKLGTGGLQRAYGQGADEALAAAPVREVLLGRLFTLGFAYNQQKTLTKLLTAHGGEIRQEDYTDVVTWTIWLPHSRWAAFAASVTEATAAQVKVVPVPEA